MTILKFKKYFLNFCGAILISIIISLISSIVVSYEFIGSFFKKQFISTSVILVTGIIVALLLVKAYNDEIKKTPFRRLTLESFTKYDKKYIKLIMILGLISIVISIIMIFFNDRVIHAYDSQATDINWNLVSGFMVIPFIEELLTRGIFFNIAYDFLDMENNIVIKIAIVVNIIMFMFLHYIHINFQSHAFILSLLVAFSPRLAIGISLTYIYMKTKDIKYNIILHTMYNFVLILCDCLYRSI
ncbi:CAAX amino terminal protease self-immunity [[Clostridium] sordellii]|uniref:CPBP family intramembrane glutamic endopeptidase n=1 Tax=Paraclostridium sordellii TaxID=1505 RepID=UPI0005DAC680|nr:CPBP family intramembrane glutamic endopeptidase [Paeniclostridium sordellii]CEN75155.1 CAAX amino terminal protease self-immunity [[Clostridium] sordellii] [Paeniclostridium sordellii]